MDFPWKLKESFFFYFFLALVAIVGIAVFIFSFSYALFRYETLNLAWCEDQAQFNQVYWNLVNRGNLSCSIYTTACFLGGKFSPIIIFIAPFYALHQNVTALLFIALAGICITGLLVYLISYHLLKNIFASFLIGLFFYIFTPVVSVLPLGYREALLTIPLFALALLFYLQKRFWPTMIVLALAAFCREEVPLILIGFSIIACFDKRSLKWRLAPGLFGAAYFYIIYCYAMPWFNNLPLAPGPVFRPNVGSLANVGGPGFGSFGQLGGSPLDIFINFFFRANVFFGLLTRPHITNFIIVLLKGMFFLPVFSLMTFIPISQYLVMFLSDRTCYASIGNHYFAPVIPFLFVGFIDALRKIKGFIDNRTFLKSLPIRGDFIIVAIILLALWCESGNIAGVLTMANKNLDFPMVNKLLSNIPNNASVSTQLAVLPNLSSRQKLYILTEYPQSDYVLLFIGSNGWPLDQKTWDFIVKKMLVSGDYGFIDRHHGGKLILFKKGAPAGNNEKIFIELYPSAPTGQYGELADLYKKKKDQLAKIINSKNNLLANGGFEKYDKETPSDWHIACWESNHAKCHYSIEKPGRNGGVAVKNSHLDFADSRWAQSVKVKPNTYYQLSGYIKTESIQNKGDGAYLQIADVEIKTPQIGRTKDWQYSEVVFKTEKDQAAVTVLCRFGGYGAPNIGTAYFDDIMLRETVCPDEVFN